MADQMEQPNLPERITFKSVAVALLGLFNLERGLFYTLWALTVQPGKAIQTYLFEDRSKLSKPFSFLFLVLALATYCSLNFLFIESVMGDPIGNTLGEEKQKAAEWTRSVMKYYLDYFNLFMLTTVPVFSICSYLLFKKPRLFLAEHFVLNSYVFAYQTAIYILMVPLMIMDFQLYNGIYLLISIIYAIYAYTKIFDYSTFEGSARGFWTILISYSLYFILLALIMLAGVFVLIALGVLEPPGK